MDNPSPSALEFASINFSKSLAAQYLKSTTLGMEHSVALSAQTSVDLSLAARKSLLKESPLKPEAKDALCHATTLDGRLFAGHVKDAIEWEANFKQQAIQPPCQPKTSSAPRGASTRGRGRGKKCPLFQCFVFHDESPAAANRESIVNYLHQA